MGERRRLRVADIAAQAGLSRATVDRALHGRDGVRLETVAQVDRAVAELERQRQQVHLSGRTVILDLVMQTPSRFAVATREALEAELPSLRPALLRARSHLSERSDPAAAAALLDRLGSRGSHGVILKAPDHPLVVDAVRRLADRGVPTVTFVTDLPGSRRVAYFGMDNLAAGATAAYLVARWAPGPGSVLLTLSSSSFRGEEERALGFRRTLALLAPHRRVHEVKDTDGLDDSMLEAVRSGLARPSSIDPRDPIGALGPIDAAYPIDAVYSIGGGNLATLQAFDEAGVAPAVFVAHDLDEDNRALLRTRRISAVLHHDLRSDLRRACRALLQARGVLPGRPSGVPSQVQVITPYNEPAALHGEGSSADR